ncbi:MAG: DUF2914 domain-containing protein [Acidobacteria bacterium]|nr:DUF2914 domain-containing protein [Acidobacteriota bacterium]
MPDLGEARQQLDLAERAALSGDFSSAREFLTSALRIQEIELGPQHPDLISTLSNLAVLAEKTGRNDEAEAGYRRVVALASSSLPSDHEMVVESRRNLEAFCREHGLEAFPPLPAPPAPREPRVSTPEAAAPRIVEQAPPAGASPAQFSTSQLILIGIAVLIVAAVVLLQISNPGPATEESAIPQGTVQTAAAEPVTPPPLTVDTPQPTPVVPERDEQASSAVPPPVAPSTAPSGAASSMVTAQLCQKFSTSGASWQCDPASDPAAQGSMVLYTRIKSTSDAVVVHRWYRGDVLRQSVRLTIRANASDGYRTYSRQTVDAGNWRVDVQSADGALLHEQSFSVR